MQLGNAGGIALLIRVDVSRLSAADLLFLAKIAAMWDDHEQKRRGREWHRGENRAALARWADDGGRAP